MCFGLITIGVLGAANADNAPSLFEAPDAYTNCSTTDNTAVAIFDIADRPGGNQSPTAAVRELLHRDFARLGEPSLSLISDRGTRAVYRVGEGSDMAVQVGTIGDSWHAEGFVACSSIFAGSTGAQS